jgi:hypothetical protein
MKELARKTGLTALALGLALPALAAGRDDDPVRRLGRTVMQWKDDGVQVVVSYRHADRHLDAPWIILQVAISARGSKVAEIAREDVLLVMPDGQKLSLPSQRALAEGMPDLRRFLREVSITREPIDGYFVGPTRVEPIQFFTVPGEGIVLDTVGFSPDRLATGDLYFHAPKGAFPPGVYTLQIYNKGVDVKLPFRMPAGDPKDQVKDKDGKSVPW